MTTIPSVSDDRTVPESTLVDLFFEAIDRHGDATAFQRFTSETDIEDISYAQVHDVVKRISLALRNAGIERGDRIAILSENRPEWAFVDWGCLCAGVIDVPIYATLLPPQIAYLLENSASKMIFVSTAEQMEKAQAAIAEAGHDVRIVVFDPPADLPAGATSYDDFLASVDADATTDQEFRNAACDAMPDDVATVLYTSGTTGLPKGVMLTHNNIASNVRSVDIVLKIRADDNSCSFLPLSHSLQRMVDFLHFWTGCTTGYPRSLDTLVADMKRLAPTIQVCVPRIYEKIYNSVMDADGLKKKIVGWAVGVADRVATLRLAGNDASGFLALQYSIADKLVFNKVKQAVGGRVRFFVSGGGPLEPQLNRFFYSIGLKVLEGYGLTETSPVTNVNTLQDFEIGYVGPPIPGTEIKIAGDGEILIRGPQIMKGYYNNPEATAAVIDSEGWFATGDIGEINEKGYLKITDRKKDIIVTAGGKNIAPQPIENRLKTHRLVEQAVVIGDRRRYCSLLIVPAFPALEAWAQENGVSAGSPQALVDDPKVHKYVEEELIGFLSDLPSYERPKRVALLAEEFSIENGMLTPTLKVKRRVVYEQLGQVIDDLYADEPADATTGG